MYSEINALLAGNADDELTGKYHEVLAQLPAMKELYGHRARLRKERGCMDIESGEVKLILDEDGHCIDVKKRTSGESEAMIEEFMLLANQCAAHFARVKQIPFVYRVHEEPNAEKLERLHGLLQACGVNDHFAKDVPTPKELSAILEGVRGTAYEQIINTGMLRCMSKAVYEEKPKGHYGLVLQDYAHFTSPIRRYPDLAIHRIMTAQLKGTDKDTMIRRDPARPVHRTGKRRGGLCARFQPDRHRHHAYRGRPPFRPCFRQELESGRYHDDHHRACRRQSGQDRL